MSRGQDKRSFACAQVTCGGFMPAFQSQSAARSSQCGFSVATSAFFSRGASLGVVSPAQSRRVPLGSARNTQDERSDNARRSCRAWRPCGAPTHASFQFARDADVKRRASIVADAVNPIVVVSAAHRGEKVRGPSTSLRMTEGQSRRHAFPMISSKGKVSLIALTGGRGNP